MCLKPNLLVKKPAEKAVKKTKDQERITLDVESDNISKEME
jgi:hypothetical protein